MHQSPVLERQSPLPAQGTGPDRGWCSLLRGEVTWAQKSQWTHGRGQVTLCLLPPLAVTSQAGTEPRQPGPGCLRKGNVGPAKSLRPPCGIKASAAGFSPGSVHRKAAQPQGGSSDWSSHWQTQGSLGEAGDHGLPAPRAVPHPMDLATCWSSRNTGNIFSKKKHTH